MATCTQAFAGLRLKASAKASPAKLSAKTTLGAKPVARAVVMSRTTRAHRLTVRAADGEAAPASDDAAPASASADEGDAPAPRGACRSDPPLRARHHRHSARFRDKASSRRVAPTASAICLATRARARWPVCAPAAHFDSAFVQSVSGDARVATMTAQPDADARIRCLARAPAARHATGFRALVLLSKRPRAPFFFSRPSRFARPRRGDDARVTVCSLSSLFVLPMADTRLDPHDSLSLFLSRAPQLAAAGAGADAVAAAGATTATASRSRWCRCSA